jgi:hypothetical protein
MCGVGGSQAGRAGTVIGVGARAKDARVSPRGPTIASIDARFSIKAKLIDLGWDETITRMDDYGYRDKRRLERQRKVNLARPLTEEGSPTYSSAPLRSPNSFQHGRISKTRFSNS